jgi:hypothetical protein
MSTFDYNALKKPVCVASIAVVVLCGVVAFYAYQRSIHDGSTARAAILAAMPAGTTAIVYADFAELRNSAFTSALYSWAPRPAIDPDYAQFLRDTSFDYERDLDRVAIAAIKHAQATEFFAIASGRFDQVKITTYASQSGTREKRGGREIFSVAVNSWSTNPAPPNSSAAPASPRRISFTFLRKDRIALTDSPDLVTLLSQPQTGQDWRDRFQRLAGSPVFAVIRQDAAAGSALATRAPGGWQSPQLAALLDQLQWITIAGKPENDRLRVVTEGECSAGPAAGQLADILKGVLLLAQAGLNGPQVRQQLDPQVREAYLEMLRSADVSRTDRGETKSVRLVFDVTPKLLQAAGAVPAVVPYTTTTPITPSKSKNSSRK